jgi:AraC-like DNA-binding protein
MRMIYLGRDHILTVAESSQPELHKHFFKHIVMSYGESLHFTVDGQEIVTKGIVINSNIFHTISCEGQSHMNFLIEGTSYLAQQIDDLFLEGKPYAYLPPELVEHIQAEKMFFTPIASSPKYYQNFYHCTEILGLMPFIKRKRDERISHLLIYLKNLTIMEPDIISKLTEKTHLSQSRLSHLFKQEIGISLSSYLTLMKTAKAYEYVFKGESITEAALKAGFSSSNHFAGTSKNLLGFSPSSLNKESIYLNFT